MRHWAVRQTASSGKLDDLARRIGERLDKIPELDGVATSPRHASRGRLRWAAMVGVIAASIAIFVNVIQTFVLSALPDGNDVMVAEHRDADRDIPASIGGRELTEKARLARELQLEFPGRFAWLMECGGEIKLGLSADEFTQPSQFVVVRFVIESQGPDDRVWKPVRALDFITRSEETVQTSLTPNHGANIAVWTYATPDGMITVDSELMLPGAAPIRVSSSRLLTSGAPMEIWHSEQDGMKYRIYQAAELLDPDQMG
jgi:hypothetical protein